jgi:hypothetical protein
LSKSEIEPKPIPIHFPNLEQKVFLFGNFLKKQFGELFPEEQRICDRTFFFKILFCRLATIHHPKNY